ncbi:MAG TPA: alginate lyase family protein [Terriglobales bacterium]|nr:alginate lyase family protein [Terriglobales bacterium]
MKRIVRTFFVVLLSPAFLVAATQPRVFLLDAKVLSAQKRNLAAAGPKAPLAIAVREAADRVMNEGPFSVMQKDITPPSGTKHDYLSLAPYFWPDPKNPKGPYIRRDGERNPDISKIPDHGNMGRLGRDARTLALAYYLTGNETYASRAALLLRTWFLDPATCMNPNLEFAQGIPGVNNGRPTGVLESHDLTNVVDAMGLLTGSKNWSDKDQKGMEEWFRAYLKWMRESPNGIGEGNAKNNHGTYYDVQVSDFALFLGDREYAQQVIKEAEKKRIALQIEPDGRQPLELARTRAFSYSVMNLRGLMELAQLGQLAGVDLWQFKTADGRSMRKALDFLVPYAAGQKKWDYKQITGLNPEELTPLLLKAAANYREPKYEQLARKLESSVDNVDVLLLQAALRN